MFTPDKMADAMNAMREAIDKLEEARAFMLKHSIPKLSAPHADAPWSLGKEPSILEHQVLTVTHKVLMAIAAMRRQEG